MTKKIWTLFKIPADSLSRSSDVTLVHSFGESQRVQGLVQVILARWEVDEHECLRVPTKAVHEEVGQLWVAIRDVRILAENNIKIVKNTGSFSVGNLGWKFSFEIGRFLYPV